MSAIERDHELTATDAAERIKGKIISVRLPGSSIRMICAVESTERIARAFSIDRDPLDARDLFSGKPLETKVFRLRKGGPGNNAEPNGERQSNQPLSDLFAQWISFYGPITKSFITETLGIDGESQDSLLAGLVETEVLILDLLTESAAEPEVCDRENLEILLRMARRARQPSFKPLKMERLNLFLASWQGLVNRGEDTEDLQDRLDQLFGFPAPADAWEKQILPARMAPYYCSWLDSLMQGSGLRWFGCGAKKLAFAFADDLELFLGRPGGTGAEPAECDAAPDAVSQLFPRKIGSYSLADIVRFSKSDSRAVTRRLWELAWKGLVNNDTFAAVRQGILTAFVPQASVAAVTGR